MKEIGMKIKGMVKELEFETMEMYIKVAENKI